MCRNPSVTIRPSESITPCSSALVATVVPCERVATSALAAAAWPRISRTPFARPIAGFAGVLATLVTSMRPVRPSTATMSVNVPPVSMPMRSIACGTAAMARARPESSRPVVAGLRGEEPRPPAARLRRGGERKLEPFDVLRLLLRHRGREQLHVRVGRRRERLLEEVARALLRLERDLERVLGRERRGHELARDLLRRPAVEPVVLPGLEGREIEAFRGRDDRLRVLRLARREMREERRGRCVALLRHGPRELRVARCGLALDRERVRVELRRRRARFRA